MTIIDLSAAQVREQVSGTEDYRTTVTGRGVDIGGDCSCPAFSDFGPCKHIAATALSAKDGGDASTRIRAHLETKDVATLVDILVDPAERDPAIFQRLDLEGASRPRKIHPHAVQDSGAPQQRRGSTRRWLKLRRQVSAVELTATVCYWLRVWTLGRRLSVPKHDRRCATSATAVAPISTPMMCHEVGAPVSAARSSAVTAAMANGIA